ncbi:hypothetical protein [Paludibaculum fermentans]|uniref:hypothetical protein n=1 Tax=Paludibaculum fermentans TaxID=1473598 RepID=UPI003EB737C3
MGLLLLRAAAGVTAGLQGAVYLAGRDDAAAWITIAGLACILAGLTLSLGLMTPISGALVAAEAVSVGMSWLPAPAQNLFNAPLSVVLIVIVAIAVVFLGPGAFSLDARLFGRREIIIPHLPRSPKP